MEIAKANSINQSAALGRNISVQQAGHIFVQRMRPQKEAQF